MTTNGSLPQTINEKMHSWSLLNPNPIVYRHPEFDELLVAWNGIHMIFEHAFMIAAMHFWSIHPTPAMKEIADEKFVKLYNMGALNPLQDPWNSDINKQAAHHTLHTMYYYLLRNHFISQLKSSTRADVFDWFQKAYT